MLEEGVHVLSGAGLDSLSLLSLCLCQSPTQSHPPDPPPVLSPVTGRLWGAAGGEGRPWVLRAAWHRFLYVSPWFQYPQQWGPHGTSHPSLPPCPVRVCKEKERACVAAWALLDGSLLPVSKGATCRAG